MTQCKISMNSARLLSLFAILFTTCLICGCAAKPAMRCVYKEGDVENIRFTNNSDYKTWVEMPSKAKGKTDEVVKSNFNGQVSKREIVISREVQSVESDGSAIMKVTIESVNLSVVKKVDKKETIKSYISTATANKTDFPGEPALAGTSYTIKVKPDTTVESILDIDDVLKKLGIAAGQETLVSGLLSLASVKDRHECDFVSARVGDTATKTTYDKNVPIKGQMPDNMIKAQALNKTYEVQPIESNGNQVVVNISGMPLHVSPEGFEKLQEPRFPGLVMIKSISVMDELNISGQGTFDLTTNKVTKEMNDLTCNLILDGNDIGGTPKKDAEKGSQGFMFTIIKLHQAYEVIE